MSSSSRPGKTAPKLLHDFLGFDPLKVQHNVNVLVDHPPPQGDGQTHGSPIGSCKHDYTTKTKQSVVPPLDHRPDPTTKYKIAAVCKKCRIHADVRIDYAQSTVPCPSSDYPLHHFRRLDAAADDVTPDRIRYAWQCSAPQCRAMLHVSYRMARLTDKEKDSLTNTEQLKRRYDAVVQQEPSRDGIRQATPIEALGRLRRYIRDSLNPAHNKRTLPANNKRFMEAFGVFGQDCRGLLERLGFKYAVSLLDANAHITEDSLLTSAQDDIEWTLPNPPELDDRLDADGSSQRELLEDVELELLAWTSKIAIETGSANTATEGWPSANLDIERTLASQGYQRHITLRRVAAKSNDELPYFASLGALPDFADSLIEFAYDRQSMCDPERTPYYFECLQVITQSRGTEQLQMKVATLSSQDVVSRRDLSAAYRFLNIHPPEAEVLSDERIVELFQAQQPDMGLTAAEEARQALNKIGTARRSQLLINASRQSVDTYEDALSWLGNGASKDMPDDTLLAIYTSKIADNKANEEVGQKAIATIARARQSNMLNNWLLTGNTTSYTMNVDVALRHLGIEQPIDDIDPLVVPVVFESARSDRPGDLTEKAIAAIQQHLAGRTHATSRSPATWPVGLTSHGNTCYLNSLLQYYFSIKPLRDIVLDYDKYKLDTLAHTEKQERVGQRKISMVEIKGGQRFAEDLIHLFQRMIKESGTAVKPEEDLVCRAFLEPKDYALLASSTNEQIPTINGLEHSVDHKIPDAPIQQDASATREARQHSDASSTTLIGSANGGDEDVLMQNGGMPPTPPASPGQRAVDDKQQPVNPPPLPPRRFSVTATAKEEALAKAKTKATMQQDVTEVHDSIMFRLRSGMMPLGMDDLGEQTDALRSLYAIGMTETRVNKGVASKPAAQIDSSVQLNVPYEATDIYSALDEVFDLQPYGESPDIETYKSIRSLPPLLQISIPRIGFDMKKGGTFKSEELVRLEDELYMDRYCDTSHPEVPQRRKRCWGWRKELQARKRELKVLSLTGVDQLDGPAAIAETASYLGGLAETNDMVREVGVEELEMDKDLPSALTTTAHQQNERLSALKEDIDDIQKRLDFQFQDLQNLKYRLAAVFIHRGTHGHGHYWVYIHDFTNNIWRMYNDEHVSEVTKLEDVFEAKTWNQGTPTYAVYVQDDKKEQVVQAVCREPETPLVPEIRWSTHQQDVHMIDGGTQYAPVKYVDPKMIEEGGKERWDSARIRRDSFDALDTIASRLGESSPQELSFVGAHAKRRRGGGGDVSPPKIRRLMADRADGLRGSSVLPCLVELDLDGSDHRLDWLEKRV
ncbi:hypothetical protein LTR08_002506 [Meristemomyces frigidus]|nr:hypothetical protein LTR08_002506 [Meristemomyces frigidus]